MIFMRLAVMFTVDLHAPAWTVVFDDGRLSVS